MNGVQVLKETIYSLPVVHWKAVSPGKPPFDSVTRGPTGPESGGGLTARAPPSRECGQDKKAVASHGQRAPGGRTTRPIFSGRGAHYFKRPSWGLSFPHRRPQHLTPKLEIYAHQAFSDAPRLCCYGCLCKILFFGFQIYFLHTVLLKHMLFYQKIYFKLRFLLYFWYRTRSCHFSS